jgi:hypothetical protein
MPTCWDRGGVRHPPPQLRERYSAVVLIDYPELKRIVTLEEVLKLENISLLPGTGRKRYGPCPLGCCSHSRAASYDMLRKLWFCHKCKQGGNQLELYARAGGANLYEASLLLCVALNITIPTVARTTRPR